MSPSFEYDLCYKEAQVNFTVRFDQMPTTPHSSLDESHRQNDVFKGVNIPVLCSPALDEAHSDGAHPG